MRRGRWCAVWAFALVRDRAISEVSAPIIVVTDERGQRTEVDVNIVRAENVEALRRRLIDRVDSVFSALPAAESVAPPTPGTVSLGLEDGSVIVLSQDRDIPALGTWLDAVSAVGGVVEYPDQMWTPTLPDAGTLSLRAGDLRRLLAVRGSTRGETASRVMREGVVRGESWTEAAARVRIAVARAERELGSETRTMRRRRLRDLWGVGTGKVRARSRRPAPRSSESTPLALDRRRSRY